MEKKNNVVYKSDLLQLNEWMNECTFKLYLGTVVHSITAFIALFHKRLRPFDRACEQREQWIKEQDEMLKEKKIWGEVGLFVPLNIEMKQKNRK